MRSLSEVPAIGAAFSIIYAGVRYNDFGIDTDASVDDAGIQGMSSDASQRIFGTVGARI